MCTNAGQKICGFLGHNGFDRQCWEQRTRTMHNTAAFKIKNLKTLTGIEKEESIGGCGYSELLLLPYFNAPKMLIIDPILGTAKHFLKNILRSN